VTTPPLKHYGKDYNYIIRDSKGNPFLYMQLPDEVINKIEMKDFTLGYPSFRRSEMKKHKIINMTGLTKKEWNDRYPNFSMSEIACPCCGLLNPDLDFLDKIQAGRHQSKIAFNVNSFCRCVKHNKNVGGEDNSKHICSKTIKSTAVDISTPDAVTRGKTVYSLNYNSVNFIILYDAVLPKDRFLHTSNKTIQYLGLGV